MKRVKKQPPSYSITNCTFTVMPEAAEAVVARAEAIKAVADAFVKVADSLKAGTNSAPIIMMGGK